MNPLEFSVLLLAWDDADPGVAVLGGAALPPTQELVYQLAAQQPVLAVYPHLPPEAPATAKGSTQLPGRKPKKPAAPVSKAPEAAEPGVRRLPSPAQSDPTATPPQTSRMVGLHDLTAARRAQPQTILGPPAAAPLAPAAPPTRSQWPPASNPTPPQPWQAPAAPYAGASSAAVVPVPAATPASQPPPAPPTPTPPPRLATTLRPTVRPQAGDLRFDPELPTQLQRTAFDEPTEEIGAAEAHDLSAPEDDIVPDAPAVAPTVAMVPPAPIAPTVRLPALEGLNFRMIQYARRAAQLVRTRSDFRVIYAPNWPAWLAALEIRNSTGQPLVLYVAGLAADFAASAERGWLHEVERMTLRRATLILVPDEHVCLRLKAQYRATIGEVRVVAAADEQGVQRVLREVAAEQMVPLTAV